MAARAPFLLLLLVASGGAVRGDDGAGQPVILQLRGIEDSGRALASDASPRGQGLMERLQFTPGCGRFAALLATTPNAGEIFREQVVPGVGGDGLTVFCPDDAAVAAFEPKFHNLSADDQGAVVLSHFAAARYERAQVAAFDSVSVRTLASSDAATNKVGVITVRDDGETMWLSPSPTSSRGSGRGGAWVTAKEEAAASGEFPFPWPCTSSTRSCCRASCGNAWTRRRRARRTAATWEGELDGCRPFRTG